MRSPNSVGRTACTSRTGCHARGVGGHPRPRRGSRRRCRPRSAGCRRTRTRRRRSARAPAAQLGPRAILRRGRGCRILAGARVHRVDRIAAIPAAGVERRRIARVLPGQPAVDRVAVTLDRAGESVNPRVRCSIPRARSGRVPRSWSPDWQQRWTRLLHGPHANWSTDRSLISRVGSERGARRVRAAPRARGACDPGLGDWRSPGSTVVEPEAADDVEQEALVLPPSDRAACARRRPRAGPSATASASVGVDAMAATAARGMIGDRRTGTQAKPCGEARAGGAWVDTPESRGLRVGGPRRASRLHLIPEPGRLHPRTEALHHPCARRPRAGPDDERGATDWRQRPREVVSLIASSTEIGVPARLRRPAGRPIPRVRLPQWVRALPAITAPRFHTEGRLGRNRPRGSRTRRAGAVGLPASTPERSDARRARPRHHPRPSARSAPSAWPTSRRARSPRR